MESVVKSKTASFKEAVLRSKYHRANSTSTVKVSSTMSKPDNSATIRAVSARLRGYIVEGDKVLSSSKQGRRFSGNPLAVFNDVSYEAESSSGEDEENSEDEEFENDKENHCAYKPKSQARLRLRLARPSVSMIAEYVSNMFTTAQCSEECNIICLIYVERLLGCCKNKPQGKPRDSVEAVGSLGGMNSPCKDKQKQKPEGSGEAMESRWGMNSDNWRGVLMTAMLLASKVWDDLSMVNEDFSMFMPYSLSQINAWEVHFLSCVGFHLTVSASEYAQYYFALREEDAHASGKQLPLPHLRELNMKQAANLHILTSCMEQRARDMHMHTQPSHQTHGHSPPANAILLRRTKSCADCTPEDQPHHTTGASPCRYVID